MPEKHGKRGRVYSDPPFEKIQSSVWIRRHAAAVGSDWSHCIHSQEVDRTGSGARIRILAKKKLFFLNI